jgi:hypothetical protein
MKAADRELFPCYGEAKTILDWTQDARCQVPADTFRQRLKRGWSVRSAIETSARTRADREYGVPIVGDITPPRTFGNYAMTDPLSLVGHMTPPRSTR